MVYFFISLKLIRKQIWTTLIVVVQIILSVISLSSLVVFIFDNQDNIRSMEELPTENTLVLTLFPYYDIGSVEKEIKNNPIVQSVGSIRYCPFSTCNGKKCNFATYNSAIIEKYKPSLASGNWFTEESAIVTNEIPAIISADMGLQVGEIADLSLRNNSNISIRVQGVLKKPTQYLYPVSYAGPKYFKADMLIANESVVIIPDEYIESKILTNNNSSQFSDIEYTQNCFIFLNKSEDDKAFIGKINRFGEITQMDRMISMYTDNTHNLIFSQTIIFSVLLLLAITGILCSDVIQIRKNRRVLTLYYLLGMDWKKCAKVEFIRNSIIIFVTMICCLMFAKLGLFPIYWLNETRVIIFFILVFLYVSALFALISAFFVGKLMHEDISLALKELHQGE